MTIVEIEFIDYGVGEEYDFLGKVIARLDVRGMDAATRCREIREMHALVGEHCATVAVEEIPEWERARLPSPPAVQ